jgi:hypothetical protein
MDPKSFPVASPGNASASQRFVNPVVKVKEYLLLNHIVILHLPKANLYGSGSISTNTKS